MKSALLYIHFMTDEKFTDGAISLFQSDNRVDNKYFIVSNNRNNSLKYVKSSNVEVIPESRIHDVLIDADFVFLHSLYCIPFDYILRIPTQIKIVWFSWGFDLYTRDVIIPLKLYHEKTIEILSNGSLLKKLLYNNYSYLIHLKYAIKYRNFLSRIAYYSGVFPYEHSLIARYNPSFKAYPLDFYYGSTNFFIPNTIDSFYNEDRKNIIIGNSAAQTNNHADALVKLGSVCNLDCERLIMPLSYGGDKQYIDKVKELGYQLFPDVFYPLDSFMPLNEYLELISNCKAAVYYLERQQASDNILMQLWYGAKVYLPLNSGMYKALKEMGIIIFSIEKDLEEINTCLPKEDVLKNRGLLVRYYSSNSLVHRIKVINNILRGETNEN